MKMVATELKRQRLTLREIETCGRTDFVIGNIIM